MATRHPKAGKGGKWTTPELKAIPAAWAGDTISDGGGLSGEVRVRGTGAVTIRFKYAFRWNGKVAWHQCGTYPDTGIADIRAERDRARQRVAEGINPSAEKKAARISEQAAIEATLAEAARQAARRTTAQAFEDWHRQEVRHRKDNGAYVRRMFEKDLLPTMGAKFLADLRRADILDAIDRITHRGSTEMAREAFTCLRQFVRFAVAREWMDSDITLALDKTRLFGRKRERERILSAAEIQELTLKIPDAGLLRATEHALWITLSTCCRIGELMAAEWKDVDLDSGLWRLPDTKNGKAHTIYLSSFAMTHFRAIQAISRSETWCFPNRNSTASVCPKSFTKQVTDRQRGPGHQPMQGRSPYTDSLSLPGGKWTAHDLRRTGASLMQQLGVMPVVIEKCLNHTPEGKVQRIYQRYDYSPEMRDAWGLLGERLELLA